MLAALFEILCDHRDVDELIAICESFDGDPPPEALARLSSIVGGSEYPDAEESSPGRDYQWELYLRALLKRDGNTAEIGDPDLLGVLRIWNQSRRMRGATRLWIVSWPA